MSPGDVVVSVVMPAYNAAAFLGDAVRSLQAQTLQAWEAIIVDDASTDDTFAVAQRFAELDARLRVVRLESNGGPAAARNAGFALANGAWIAVLDADDVYLPERLNDMVAVAEKLDADIVADNQWLKDPAHGKIVRSGVGRRGAPRRIDLITLYLKSLSASGFDYGTLKPVFKTAFLRRANIAYRPLRYGEDFAFFAELLALGARAWLISTPYYVYTLTRSELDGRKSESSRTLTNYDLLFQSNNAILEGYSDRLTDREKAAIHTRAHFIEEYRYAMAFKDQRRNKDYVGMMRTLARHPLILVMILRGVRWRLRAMAPDQRAPQS